MKTQTSQQHTPKNSQKYLFQIDSKSKSPLRSENFFDIYDKYLNLRQNTKKKQEDQVYNQIQISASLHYANKNIDNNPHRFSLDNFKKPKSKGIQSNLTTVNSSNSINQKSNHSYYNNNESVDQSLQEKAINIQTLLCKTKSIVQKISIINKQNKYLITNPISQKQLIQIIKKTKIALLKYNQENKQLKLYNQMLSERLNLLDENNKIKDAEIKRLTLMIQNH